MTGLRDRKKQRTLRAILDAARERMTAHGYDATTIESVAARADVSVGTVYNYFDSKRALLLGIMADATDRVAEQAAPLVAAPGDDGLAAVRALLHRYADAMAQLDPSLLRHAVAVSIIAPPEVAAEAMRLDEILLAQTAALVAALQERDAITRALAAEQVAFVLYGAFAVAMLLWATLPGATAETLTQTLDAQLAVVFRGLAPTPPNQRT